MNYPEDYINKIHCADCLEFMKDIPDKSIDLVLTDPPYGIDYQSNMRTKSVKFDKLENDDNEFRFKAYKEFNRVLKNDTVAIVFCSFKNYAYDYIELEKYFSIKNAIIWYKGGGGIGDLKHSLLTDYEIGLVCHNGKLEIKGKREGSVWKINKVPPAQMFHPTEKPLFLLRKFLLQFSNEGDLILDPFLGSGSTTRACKDLHRNYIGIEISPKYYEIAEERLRQEVLL